MNLVIVESPAKAKTIKKYLGKDFDVLASYGHVRDLVPKEGAVDPDAGFRMSYDVIDRNTRHVKAIADKLKKADALYLATDPDREGEAISWHLYELLKARRVLKDKPVHRVVFHEITKKAILDAVANPRPLSMDLVNAQQARRALDYLVGFNLSPLLWKKVRRGLSAGRVQSPALRMIVERELEIEAFETREFWTVEADSTKNGQAFSAKLSSLGDEKIAAVQHYRRRKSPRRERPAAGSGPWQTRSTHGGEEATPAQPGRALHHLHPAAGGLAQARLHRAAHHAHRPAAVRGRRYRRRAPSA